MEINSRFEIRDKGRKTKEIRQKRDEAALAK